MPIAAPLAAAGAFVSANAVPLAIAGTGLAGAAISSSAAKSAAKTQAASATQAADTQLKMFDTIRNDLSGYRNFGSTALPGLAKLLGLDAGGGSTYGTGAGITVPGASAGSPDWNAYLAANPDVAQYGAGHLSDYGDVNQDGTLDLTDFAQGHYGLFGQKEGRNLPTIAAPAVTPAASTGSTSANPNAGIMAQLESMPGYQFARDQGVASVGRALGSKGLTGAQAKGISRFVTGLADQTYGEQVNRLMGAATLGQNAAAQTGSFGTQAASGAAQSQIGAGTALASGQVGSANALSAGLSSIPNAFLYNKILGSGSGSSGLYGATTTGGSNGVYYGDGGYRI